MTKLNEIISSDICEITSIIVNSIFNNLVLFKNSKYGFIGCVAGQVLLLIVVNCVTVAL